VKTNNKSNNNNNKVHFNL